MLTIYSRRWQIFLGVLITYVLLACSPNWNWREVRNNDAAFSVLLPAKSVTHTRAIDLNGLHVDMLMTAAEVDGVTFAVGSALLPDTSKSEGALAAMQVAMINNIHGEIREKKQITLAGGSTATEIIATGYTHNKNQPWILAARFVSQGHWVHQVIALGPEKNCPPDVIDTFLTSFKLN